MARILSVDTGAPGEKQAQWGKHRTEVAEVTEGGLGRGENASVDTGLLGEKCPNRGKHRTEVTEIAGRRYADTPIRFRPRRHVCPPADTTLTPSAGRSASDKRAPAVVRPAIV